MKSKYLALVLIPLLLFMAPIQATDEDEGNAGSWNVFSLKYKINSDWSVGAHIQIRKDAVFHDFNQMLNRFVVGYKINDNISTGIAYTSVFVRREVEENVNDVFHREHRLHQEVNFKHGFKRLDLKHRYRFEQRFFKDDFDLRVRYLLDLRIPFNNTEIADKTVYGFAQNEVLFNTTKDAFNSNRFLTGIGYKLGPLFGIEAGYMNIALSSYKSHNLYTKISMTF